MCSNTKAYFRETPPQGQSIFAYALLPIIIGLFLRLRGIDFQLPYLYYPDEAPWIKLILRMLNTGDFNPYYAIHPSLYYYINLCVAWIFGVYHVLIGEITSFRDLPVPEVLSMGVGYTSMPGLILSFRAASALTGTLTILIVFALTHYATKCRVLSTFAAFLLALSPTHLKSCWYLNGDVYVIFFVTLVLFAALKALRNGKPINYMIAGLCSGLAASAKYNGGLSLLLPLCAFVIRLRCSLERSWANARIAVMASFVAFCVTSPFLAANIYELFAGLSSGISLYYGGKPGTSGSSLAFYADCLFFVEGYWVLFSILGAVVGVYRMSPPALLVSVFAILYLSFISSFSIHTDYVLLPVISALIFLAAFFLSNLRQVMTSTPQRSLLSVVLLLLTLWIPAQNSFAALSFLTKPDGRSLGQNWVNAHVPPGSHIVVESYSVFPDRNKYTVTGVFRLSEHPPEWYRTHHVNYFVASSCMFGRFFRERERYGEEVAKYEALTSSADLEARFGEKTSCEVFVYRFRA